MRWSLQLNQSIIGAVGLLLFAAALLCPNRLMGQALPVEALHFKYMPDSIRTGMNGSHPTKVIEIAPALDPVCWPAIYIDRNKDQLKRTQRALKEQGLYKRGDWKSLHADVRDLHKKSGDATADMIILKHFSWLPYGESETLTEAETERAVKLIQDTLFSLQSILSDTGYILILTDSRREASPTGIRPKVFHEEFALHLDVAHAMGFHIVRTKVEAGSRTHESFGYALFKNPPPGVKPDQLVVPEKEVGETATPGTTPGTEACREELKLRKSSPSE